MQNEYLIEVPEKVPNYAETKCDNIDMQLFSKREYAEQEKMKYRNLVTDSTLYEIYVNVDHLSEMLIHTDYGNRVIYIRLNYSYSNSRVNYEEEMYFDYETELVSHRFRKSRYHFGRLFGNGYTSEDQKHTIICGNRVIKSIYSSTETDGVDINTRDIINGRKIIKSVYGMRELANKIVKQINL